MNKKIIKEKISDHYIRFCETNNIPIESGMVLTKFFRELMKEIDGLYLKEVIDDLKK